MVRQTWDHTKRIVALELPAADFALLNARAAEHFRYPDDEAAAIVLRTLRGQPVDPADERAAQPAEETPA